MGLALSPFADPGGGAAPAAAAAAFVLALARPPDGPAGIVWLALVAAVAVAGGLALGAARLQAIDAGGYRSPVGARASLTGHLAAVPKRSGTGVRLLVDTERGRLAVESAPPPPAELAVGAEIRAAGTIAAPPPWLREYLRRQGVARVLKASHLALTGGRRGGLAGRVDALRRRAERALGRGIPDAQAALARGFVLGQDDRIPAATVEDFRRSGLAHLLAVSGQNVLLLALLAVPLLGLLGIPLRARLAWLLVLVAIYVPLAGAGPSIQRAGAMGAAAIVATLAGRPASRLYALLLAAAATLALNPLAAGDVGWQLSFAAVVGILVAVSPLRQLLLARIGDGGWRRSLADGLAVTVAATLATAPLMAHHFDAVSATSLAANLLALPAVAPAMWLGMLVAAFGQLPAIPVEPLNWVNSLLLAYIGEVAGWMARPGWALVAVRLRGPIELAAAYAALLAATLGLRRWFAGREGLGSRPARRAATPIRTAAAIAAAIAAFALLAGGGGRSPRPPTGLRVSVLDVGQGDAILLQPADGAPVLVDGGPPASGLGELLSGLDVGSLAAVVISHDQSDHAGGIEELLGTIPVGRFVYAGARPSMLGAARTAGAAPLRVAEGSELRSGSLRLQVLWPPAVPMGGAGSDDPNAHTLVLLARWRRFEMLLTGDAEAEAAPIDPGPVDVLKVAHHGSADAGLPELLEHAAPRLAVISVGAGNPFGHPDPGTIAALASRGVRILRSDRSGTVTLEVGREGGRIAVSAVDEETP